MRENERDENEIMGEWERKKKREKERRRLEDTVRSMHRTYGTNIGDRVKETLSSQTQYVAVTVLTEQRRRREGNGEKERQGDTVRSMHRTYA